MEDREVLKYKGMVLRVSDINTLRGPCFLNDTIIAFYFCYLLFSCEITDDILLVNPSVSVCLAHCGKEDKFVEDFAQSSKLSSKRLVLFVVNDVDVFNEGDSGSHWSILVYDREKNLFLHCDSIRGMNNFHALKLYDAIKEYVGPGGEVSGLQTSSSWMKKQNNKKRVWPVYSEPKHDSVITAVLPEFVECKAPQQRNGYDCGLYVLAIAKAICECCCHGNTKDDVLSAIEKQVDYSVEMNMRSEVLRIIQQLAED